MERKAARLERIWNSRQKEAVESQPPISARGLAPAHFILAAPPSPFGLLENLPQSPCGVRERADVWEMASR